MSKLAEFAFRLKTSGVPYLFCGLKDGAWFPEFIYITALHLAPEHCVHTINSTRANLAKVFEVFCGVCLGGSERCYGFGRCRRNSGGCADNRLADFSSGRSGYVYTLFDSLFGLRFDLRLIDLYLGTRALTVNLDGSLRSLRGFKCAEDVPRRRPETERRVTVRIIGNDINFTFDIVLTKVFSRLCGLCRAELLDCGAAFGGKVLLKLTGSAEFPSGSKLDHALKEGARKCASACIAQKVLTDFNIGIVDPVLHKVVGDTGGGFLSAFCRTSGDDPRQAVLDNPLDKRGLRNGNLAEKCGERAEEAAQRECFGRANEAAQALCRKLVFFGNLHTGSKLVADTLRTLFGADGNALSCGSGGRQTLCQLCTAPQKRRALRHACCWDKE